MDIKRVITALSAGIGTRQKKLAVVFFRGETPSATENTIFIPLSVCEDRNLLNKGIAYCIHEVGHTVFSSYEDWYIKRLNEDKKLRHLENILEDAVVEAGMIQNHPGAVLFLEPLMEEFLPGVWQKAKIADLRSATFTHCMMHSRSQVYPRLQVAAELRSKSREAVERFGSVELADQLEAVMDGPGSSLERGEQILELLAEQASSEQSPGPQAQEDESESSPQDPETGDEGGESDEPPEDGSAQEPASSESSDDDGDGQAPSEQSPEPQAQEDESESSPQDPETGDEGGESDDFPEEGSAQEPASSESSDDDGDGQAPSEQSPEPQAQEDEPESSPQDPETGDEGGESDDFPEEGSAQEPASSENSDDDGDGQAPSEQSPEPQAQEDESESNQQDPETGDTVEPIFDFANWLIANAPSTADDPPLTVAFAPSKDQAIRPNAALLRVAEALTASYSRKTGSVKKGKGQAIRTNNLALVETGLPIFGRRATTLGSAAHYVLLLDQSGSMSPIWDSAVECTMTMANAMERVGDVRVEVMTYYRNVEWDGDSQTLTMKDCRINHVVDRKRYPDIRPEGTTPTADALAYAWDTLKPSRYERKGIIVITDGIADTEHSGLSRQIEDSGVELYAIGLGVTDSAFLQHNFSRWVTASIAELPTKLMQALSPAA